MTIRVTEAQRIQLANEVIDHWVQSELIMQSQRESYVALAHDAVYQVCVHGLPQMTMSEKVIKVFKDGSKFVQFTPTICAVTRAELVDGGFADVLLEGMTCDADGKVWAYRENRIDRVKLKTEMAGLNQAASKATQPIWQLPAPDLGFSDLDALKEPLPPQVAEEER